MLSGCNMNWLFHELTEAMVEDGFLTRDKFRDVRVRSISRYMGFGPPFESSFLVPDMHLRPADSRMPSVVIKTGLDTPYQILADYKDAWLEGGSVNVFILVKWETTEDKYVRGRMEIWRRGVQNPETFCLFPRPSSGSEEMVTIRRDELCGSKINGERDPRNTLLLSVNRYRDDTVNFMRWEDYKPALE